MRTVAVSFLIAVLFALTACTTPTPKVAPPEFKLGKPVAPPAGCIEYRKRGGKC